MEKQLPRLIKSRLFVWYLTAYIYQSLHNILGIGGSISSILVASKPQFISTEVIDILAVISSICFVVLAFLLPSRRASAVQNAWRRLSIASDRFLLEENYSITDLLTVAEQCEERISVTDPS